MNRLNIRDFSNVYSPKNKALNNKLTKTLQTPSITLNSTLNNTLTPKNNPFSPRNNLSPRNPVSPRHRNPQNSKHNTSGNNAQIANIPYIQQVRKINKLKLSKQKRIQITYSLSIDEISRKAFLQRMRTDQHYLQYDRNPLSDLTENYGVNQQQFIGGKFQNKDKNQEISLLRAIDELNQRNNTDKLKNKKVKNTNEVNEIYVRMKNKQQSQLATKNKKTLPQTLPSNPLNPSQDPEDLRSPFDQLDDIVNLKDDNYFARKRNLQPFNLFQLKFNPHSKMFQSGRQQLNQHYFSFDSMSTNAPSPLNETMLRAMSTYARIAAVKSNSRAIPNDFKIDQHNFRFIDFQKIGLEDIIQVANGQMRGEILLRYINDQVTVTQKKVEEGDTDNQQLKNTKNDLVILKPNMKNQQLNFQEDNFEKTQLLYLKRDYITPLQSRQQDLSAYYLKKMKATLTEQLKLLNSTIEDNTLHKYFRREKDEIMINQIDADADLSRRMMETERKIRLNKVNKNQTEKIKITEVTKTCKERRNFEKGFKTPVVKSRSKSWKLIKDSKDKIQDIKFSKQKSKDRSMDKIKDKSKGKIKDKNKEKVKQKHKKLN